MEGSRLHVPVTDRDKGIDTGREIGNVESDLKSHFTQKRVAPPKNTKLFFAAAGSGERPKTTGLSRNDLD